MSKQTKKNNIILAVVSIMIFISWIMLLETFVWVVANYVASIQPLPDFWEANVWLGITAWFFINSGASAATLGRLLLQY